jgi:hypothetical protein
MGRAVVRYGAGLVFLVYGFAKVNGSQVTRINPPAEVVLSIETS